MNEKRLIDVDALIDAIELTDWYHVDSQGHLVHGANSAIHEPLYKEKDIVKAIEAAPIVGAAEVVLCRDCIHWDVDEL